MTKGEVQAFNKSILPKSLCQNYTNYYHLRLNISVTDTKIVQSSSKPRGRSGKLFITIFTVTNILYVECCLKKLSRTFRECIKQKGFEEKKATALIFEVIFK